MDHIVRQVLRFDRFALDLTRGCLRAGDEEIDLRPKTFEVLCYFSQNAGRLLTKQEIFEAVWPSVSVCDDSLVQCIRELRRKLGDEERRLIKTVSRRGYLMDAAVSIETSQSSSEGSAAKLAEAAQKPARGLVVLHRALRAIPARKLRIWGAAAVVMYLALGIIYLFGLPVLAPNQALVENVTGEPHTRPTFRDCADCPEMVALPAGEFMMGSPESEPWRQPSEGLPRRVVLKKSIAIGRFEVTVDQFSAFVAETRLAAGDRCRTIIGDTGEAGKRFVLGPPQASFQLPGFAVTGAYPALCISWHDAQEYAAWLRRRTGKPYRLPTEAEWEYAARAGTRTMYSFGGDPAGLCAHGRFVDYNSSFPWRSGCGSDTGSAIPVGQLKPNPWGIYDMHGNAWEWVEDCWTTNASEIPADGTAFSRAASCDLGVVRGGSWANAPSQQRSATRRWMERSVHLNHIGFRVALSIGE
jgi:formylglycine-generating enzyme required for sulfatase activity